MAKSKFGSADVVYIVADSRSRMPRTVKIAKALKADIIDMSREDAEKPIKQYFDFSIRTVIKLLRSRYKHVFIYNIPATPIFPVLVASKIKGFTVVVDFINLWEYAAARYDSRWLSLMRLYERFVYKRIKWGLAQSQSLISTVEKMGAKRVFIILDCADHKIFLPEDKKVDKSIIVVSNLVKHEGVDVLLKALAIVKRSHEDFNCTILGDGPRRKSLMELAKELKLDANVKFVGHIPYQQVPNYLKTAEIGIAAPKNIQGFELPIKVFEYMSAGLAIIATDTPGLRSVITPNKNGLLFEDSNHEDLANCILTLFENVELRQKLRMAAREDVEKRFNWDSQVDKLRSIMTEIMSNR